MITAKEARKISTAHNRLISLYDAIEKAAKEGRTEAIFVNSCEIDQQSIFLMEEDLKKNGYNVFVQYRTLYIAW